MMLVIPVSYVVAGVSLATFGYTLVCCILIRDPGGKLRKLSTLLVHYSFATLLYVTILLVYLLYQFDVAEVKFNCELWLFFLNVCSGTLYLSHAAIVQKIKSKACAVFDFLTIGIIWSTALMGSIPAFFAEKYLNSDWQLLAGLGRCKQITLAGSVEAFVIYELLWLVLLPLTIAGYIFFSLCKTCTKYRMLHSSNSTSNVKIFRRLQQASWIHVNCIIFILSSVLFGFLMVRNILIRQLNVLTNIPEKFQIAIVALHLIHCILNPFITLYSVENSEEIVIFYKETESSNGEEFSDNPSRRFQGLSGERNQPLGISQEPGVSSFSTSSKADDYDRGFQRCAVVVHNPPQDGDDGENIDTAVDFQQILSMGNSEILI